MTESSHWKQIAPHRDGADRRIVQQETIPVRPWRPSAGQAEGTPPGSWDTTVPGRAAAPARDISCPPPMPCDCPERRGSAGRRMGRGLLETIIPAVIIALLINLFVAQATRVYGQSMEPSLHTNQRLVVEKVSYSGWLHLRSLQRGDVVVLHAAGVDELLIKRVIGLPGDRIEIRNGQVFVNRVPMDEPYVASPASGDYGPVDVPPLQLFVLGDNRDFSNDSRGFGPVPIKDIVGRAWLCYWPPEVWGPVP